MRWLQKKSRVMPSTASGYNFLLHDLHPPLVSWRIMAHS